MLFARWATANGCENCIVMHQCGGRAQVWMCKDSDVRCPTDKATLAPEMEYKAEHAGCGCPYCQRNIGFCAGDDLQQGMHDFMRIKDIIQQERDKSLQT